ncbi:MAG: aldehyde dehydrogenase family protein [Pseudomonadota bacterium]|nr:aldehyde dehydrogenase family protein [Pseudomonadota bacterium]
MRPIRERLLRKGDYVNGSFLKPEQVDGYINAVNPGDRTDVLGRFPFSTRSVDDAIEFATLGAARWRRVGLNDRAAALRRFREQLHHAQETLARLVTRENGKPLWEARQEVQSALRTVDIYLDDGVGLLAPRIVEEISARTDYVPRGVVGVVSPYNLPALLGIGMTAAAVLAGNAVVIKPSKFTPGVGQLIAELWDRSKLPRGVVSLVHGSGSVIGQRLVGHAGLDALLFAGSFESARDVRRATAERPELPALYQSGGKGIAIVLDDAELDRAVYEVLVGAFMSTGQRHNSTGRIFVTEGIYERFAAELVRRAQRLRVGYGFDNDVFMGPLISENFRTRFRKYCRAVTSKGHTALLEGDSHEVQGYRGNYAKPGIYRVDWKNGSPFLNDEPPGPIALLYVVKNWEEAVTLHNQAQYRMTASIFTRPQNPNFPELRDALRTGSVNLNRGTIGQSLRLPTSGLGRSGNGVAGGIELLRVLTVPRGSLSENRPFDTQNLVPGVAWSDEEDDEADLGGALELAVE